ncbi:MAG: hypothetical protein J5700_04555, partial [Treponema sp.]|nr:hypothetical protein [Treponema sp.]
FVSRETVAVGSAFFKQNSFHIFHKFSTGVEKASDRCFLCNRKTRFMFHVKHGPWSKKLVDGRKEWGAF